MECEGVDGCECLGDGLGIASVCEIFNKEDSTEWVL